MAINGPLPIYVRDASGELTDQLATGVHYNISADALTPEMEPYRVIPSAMQNVWAGDDPEAPEWTVALRFPDQATADSVLFPTP